MLLCVGLVTLDIIVDRRAVTHASGGTAGNVAAMTSWLGLPSALAARVGTDRAGNLVCEDLARCGVDLSRLVREASPTCSIVHQIKDGAHEFSTICPECHRQLPSRSELTAKDLDTLATRLAGCETIFVDRVDAQLVGWLRQRISEGTVVVYEPWRRESDELAAAMFEMSQLVKFSEDPVLLAALEAFPRHAQGLDIVTRGSAGLRWRQTGQSWQEQDGAASDLVDAAGAGDWLTSAFLAGDGLRSRDAATFEERLLSAQRIAAASVCHAGAKGLMSAKHCSADAQTRALALPRPIERAAPPEAGEHRGCRVCLRG